MERRFVTVDVFTDRMFGGNPLAVVLDAEGLDTARMQAIAREFNYSETSFVLPPADPAHHARVRIFTPAEELPFAGHPNIGTAFALAVSAGRPVVPETFLFEEGAGLVRVRLLRDAGAVVGAELTAPAAMRRGPELDPVAVAAVLSLPTEAMRVERHRPGTVSVGLGFLLVELAAHEALRAIRFDAAAFGRLGCGGIGGVYAYVRSPALSDAALRVRARMMWPFDGLAEDPATGSAAAALGALEAALADRDGEILLAVEQGIEMGRPSLLRVSAVREGGQVGAVRVGGRCVAVMQGRFALPGAG